MVLRWCSWCLPSLDHSQGTTSLMGHSLSQLGPVLCVEQGESQLGYQGGVSGG